MGVGRLHFGPIGVVTGDFGVGLVGTLVRAGLQLVHLRRDVGFELRPLGLRPVGGLTDLLLAVLPCQLHVHPGLVDLLLQLRTRFRRGPLHRRGRGHYPRLQVMELRREVHPIHPLPNRSLATKWHGYSPGMDRETVDLICSWIADTTRRIRQYCLVTGLVDDVGRPPRRVVAVAWMSSRVTRPRTGLQGDFVTEGLQLFERADFHLRGVASGGASRGTSWC